MSVLAGIYPISIAKPVDPARVRAMANAQTHHGGNDAGVWTAPGIGLAHRDAAAGAAQPLLAADGGLALICDGAILNGAALRAELTALGHGIGAGDDAALILHAWRQWGPQCLAHLDGAFAFALFDAGQQCLFLARDRLGVKPLHYAVLGDESLIFSSELGGLLVHPLFRCEVEARAVDDYMALGYVPDDRCMVAGVHKLAAGYSLLVRRGKPLPAPVRWWDVDFTAHAGGARGALREGYRDRLGRAVRAAMGDHAASGALLSGGVNSSAVVALMAAASSRAVESRTLGFSDAALSQGDPVAERFLTHHARRRADPADPALDAVTALFDEPVADASALLALRLCQFAGESLAVVLAGDGAGEAMGGLARHHRHVVAERVRAMLPGRIHAQREDAAADSYARRLCVMTPTVRARLYAPGFRQALDDYRAEGRYRQIMRDAPADDALGRAQYADLKLLLPGQTLTWLDRAGRATGVDVRLPLIDHNLVQYAAGLPAAMRLRRGPGRGLVAQAMAASLPEPVRKGAGASLTFPVDDWFRGALVDQAARLARHSMLAETGWLDRAAIDGLASAHLGGAANHGKALWQLLMLDRALLRLFG